MGRNMTTSNIKIDEIQWGEGNSNDLVKLIKSAEGSLELAKSENNQVVISALENDLKIFNSILTNISKY